MSGHFGDLSPAQEAALITFREAVKDIPLKPEDNGYYYLRWLRARKFDIDKSLEMFKNHMRVREEYKLDTILTDYTVPEAVRLFSPGGFFGEDREGHPVWYDFIGRIDLRGFYRSVKKEDVIKSKLAQLEQRAKICKDLSEKHGKKIETTTIVLDFEGLTWSGAMYWPGLELVREIFKVSEANAPETGKTTVIIKAPAIFPVLFNIVKPMMHERTRKKIVILGSNWQEELLKLISPDQLPQMYGGTRCEPDPECSDYINPGGIIPEKYYLANNMDHSKDTMSQVVVPRGQGHRVELPVTQEGSLIKWEFMTDDYDIAFSLSLNGEEMVTCERRACHIIPESGAYLCKYPGTYEALFDNSFSWTRSKQLYFSIEVIPPTNTE